jgi:hypothetical protein
MSFLITQGLGRPVDGGKSALITTMGLGQWGASDCALSYLAPLLAENNGSYVDIIFNANVAISGPAADYTNWDITENSIYADPSISAVEVVSGNRVRLTISEQTALGTYTIQIPTLGVTTDTGSPLVGPFSIDFLGIGVGPDVAMAKALDARTLEVIFTEAVREDDATTVSNYSIAPPLTVSAAVKVTDLVYRLTTSKQTYGTVYTVTISNIRDLANNPIP